jgi:hypothetical protein
MKNVLLIVTSLLTSSISFGFTTKNESGLYAKCSITISKMGSPDKQACQSLPLPTKCIPESPGEEEMCSPTGKISIQNESVTISAEFMNHFLSAWVNNGDNNWTVTKVFDDAVRFPLSFNTLTPVRGHDQLVTGETAFISCTLISANDEAIRGCP